jgi:hypothetical protein
MGRHIRDIFVWGLTILGIFILLAGICDGVVSHGDWLHMFKAMMEGSVAWTIVILVGLPLSLVKSLAMIFVPRFHSDYTKTADELYIKEHGQAAYNNLMKNNVDRGSNPLYTGTV